MGRGNYLGGSTVVKVYGTSSRGAAKRGTSRGLLHREVAFLRTGDSTSAPLLATPIAPSKKKAKDADKTVGTPGITQKKSKPRSHAKGGSAPADTPKGLGSTTTITRETVMAYFATHHPKIPKESLRTMGKFIHRSTWANMTLAQVIARTVDQHLRFDICGLSRLIATGVKQDEAERLIEPQMTYLRKLWGVPKP